MLDSQSIHLTTLDSADLLRLQAVLDVICREAGKPKCSSAMQEIAAVLIRLYRQGVTEEDKLLSLGLMALTQKVSSPVAADSVQSPSEAARR
ncbi:hypothetical protein ATY78_18130 [Rhizobium sp. R635]|uniref:hypothetical protein n=1 Tax=Rhizobium sp. R635 TaxID=1764275 RepID=UPI000B5325A4|nr:hypothetical protein [Rhizobium sp. R635]OWV89814.1 hypothetical protein ATY78_18130 [Rhizobium sp. R635]